MANRFQAKTRLWVYRFLVIRDGEFCQRCHKSPAATFPLEIDHIDGNPKNDAPGNLQLLCKRCNIQIRNTMDAYSAKWGREGEKTEGKANTRIAKSAANYREGSPEMQANLLYEVAYRKWLLKEINTQGGLDKKEAINAGAELVGCSPNTTKRYLEKLTSAGGCLKEDLDMLGHPYLVFKESFAKSINIDLSPQSLIEQAKLQRVKQKHQERVKRQQEAG